MTHRMPDLYLYVGQTHVHHLNYGIFLLCALSAYLLFYPQLKPPVILGILYGIGLGLTFDEFGMWIHLGGGYWQWASFHACVIVLSILLILGFMPTPSQFKANHVMSLLVLAALLGVFFYLFPAASNDYRRLMPDMEHIEQTAPR